MDIIVPRTPNTKTISARWVFKVKEDSDNKKFFKARLVARGCEDYRVFDFKEIYAPVVALSTVRLLISLGLNLNMSISQLDIKNVFLNGDLEDDVFLEISEGLISLKEGHVLKLNKALYGLKQAPSAWNKKFDNFMKKLGFIGSKYDECLYVRITENDRAYVAIYVDDIIIIAM